MGHTFQLPVWGTVNMHNMLQFLPNLRPADPYVSVNPDIIGLVVLLCWLDGQAYFLLWISCFSIIDPAMLIRFLETDLIIALHVGVPSSNGFRSSAGSILTNYKLSSDSFVSGCGDIHQVATQWPQPWYQCHPDENVLNWSSEITRNAYIHMIDVDIRPWP